MTGFQVTEVQKALKGASYPMDGTALADWLRARDVDRVDVCGIATDHCVRATALDGVRHGFATTVLLDLTAAVDPGRTDQVVTELTKAGAAVTEQA